MSLESNLRKAGLLTYADEASIVHYRFSHEAKARERRFRDFRKAIAMLSHKAQGVYPARLIGLDMVRPSQIALACKADVYRHQGQPNIEWVVGECDRIERRVISPLTALSHSPQANAANPIGQLKALLADLECYADVHADVVTDELEIDMCIWAVRNLTGPMGAHVCGLRPMWAVTRETLGRAEFQKVLASAVAQISEEFELLMTAFEEAASSATANQEDDALLKLALSLISVDSQKSDQENFDAWLVALLKLKERIHHSDPTTAIIICWIMDLTESGTARTPDASMGTRVRYIRVTSMRLWRAIKASGKTLDQLTADQIGAIYLTMMADKSCTDLRGLGAGIASFQNYAQEVWDFPEVNYKSTGLVPESKPRVQLVHPHELALARQWLSDAKEGDQYAIDICILLLDLFNSIPCRLEELLWVRIKNIAFSEDGSLVEIELYPAPGFRFKTPGSTRRETLSDPTAIAKLRQWLARRKFDEAAEDDYVFGRENLPGLYRRSLIIGTLRVVLKAVTGDASMTIYALRHTVASRQFAEDQSADIQNRNRHFQSAEDLGHVAPPMGFENYKHTYEQALARELAALNKEDIKFVDSDAPKLTKSSREAVRTMASRKKGELSISDVIWQSLEREADDIAFGPVADVDKWVVPEAPKLTIAGHIVGSALQVLTIVQKLKSFSIQDVALLSDHPIDLVKATSECIFKLAHQRRKLLPPEKRARAPALITVQDALDELNIDITAADQAKYASLKLNMAKPMDKGTLASIVQLWPDFVHGNYLRLDIKEVTVPLLQFLHQLGVHAEHLHVLVQPCKKQGGRLQHLSNEIAECFTAIWNAQPAYFQDEIDHDSRPDAYLQLPKEKGKVASRSDDVRGLISLLFCTTIFGHLTNEGIYAAT